MTAKIVLSWRVRRAGYLKIKLGFLCLYTQLGERSLCGVGETDKRFLLDPTVCLHDLNCLISGVYVVRGGSQLHGFEQLAQQLSKLTSDIFLVKHIYWLISGL